MKIIKTNRHNDNNINIKFTTVQNPLHLQKYIKCECSICLDNIDEDDFITTYCKHTYHTHCILDLYYINRINTKCPLCRTNIYNECAQLKEAFIIAFENKETVYKNLT
jgi:hypothetical protein